MNFKIWRWNGLKVDGIISRSPRQHIICLNSKLCYPGTGCGWTLKFYGTNKKWMSKLNSENDSCNVP